jgi:CDP-2,3-bis-(O-geranylgeranyl)-sn-glycerol synthase
MEIAEIARNYLYLLIVFLPAMVANGSPVVFKGSKPLDMGKHFIDGHRILGDGKTIEGFIVGVTAGSVFGIIEAVLAWNIKYVVIGFLGGLGAMLGDITGSFIKRRLGYERGHPILLLDQLDFALCSTILYYAYGIEMDLTSLLLVYTTIFVLHILTNRIAYRAGLKNVPY